MTDVGPLEGARHKSVEKNLKSKKQTQTEVIRVGIILIKSDKIDNKINITRDKESNYIVMKASICHGRCNRYICSLK